MRHPRRGFLLEDAIIGLAIVLMLAMVLAVAANRQSRVAAQLSDSRAALRAAEQALARLQAGAPVDSAAVTLQRLPDPPPSTGWAWTTITSTCNGRQASLTGLVPENALPKATVKP